MAKRILISSPILLVLVTVGAFFLFRRPPEVPPITKANKKLYREWKNKRITLPADALDVKPFLPETEIAAKAFREEWARSKDQAIAILVKHGLLPKPRDHNAEMLQMIMNMPGMTSSTLASLTSASLSLPFDPKAVESAYFSSTAISSSSSHMLISPSMGKNGIRSHEVRSKSPSGQNSNEIDFSEAKRDLQDIRSLIKSCRQLVLQPDYEISAYNAGLMVDEHEGLPHVPDFQALRAGAKLLQLQAMVWIRQNQQKEALDTGALIIRAGRCNSLDLLIAQEVSASFCLMGAITLNDIVTSCTESISLRESLERQNQMRDGITFFSRVFSAKKTDSLSTQSQIVPGSPELSRIILNDLNCIREAKRRGFAIGVETTTGRELAALSSKTMADYAEKTALPMVASEPEKTKEIAWFISANREMAACFQHPTATALLRHPRSSFWKMRMGFMFKMLLPADIEQDKVKALIIPAQFNLLRLNTARKIFELEKGKLPARMQDLPLELLPKYEEDRRDPFANPVKPYALCAGGFYSVGRDHTDQKGGIVYDASNGTMSEGDIVLVWK